MHSCDQRVLPVLRYSVSARESQPANGRGMNLNGRITLLVYADDSAALVESEEGMLEKAELKINAGK